MCQHTDPEMTLKHRDLIHSGRVATKANQVLPRNLATDGHGVIFFSFTERSMKEIMLETERMSLPGH